MTLNCRHSKKIVK
ncbi:hypothetical protein LINPERHAP1_LOCUS350 [Linum perenne]